MGRRLRLLGGEARDGVEEWGPLPRSRGGAHGDDVASWEEKWRGVEFEGEERSNSSTHLAPLDLDLFGYFIFYFELE